jgi:hypothetical protein
VIAVPIAQEAVATRLTSKPHDSCSATGRPRLPARSVVSRTVSSPPRIPFRGPDRRPLVPPVNLNLAKLLGTSLAIAVVNGDASPAMATRRDG